MQYRLRLAVMCATTVLFAALVGLLLGLIFLAPIVCAVIGAMIGAAYWMFCLWAADRFAIDAYDAQLVDAVTSPNLYKALAKLSTDAGIEQPLVYSLPYGPPNAYAVARPGRSSVIVLSNALTRSLDHDEVRAILALMVARIAESDSAACSIAATLAGIPYYGVCHPGFRGWIRERMKVDPDTGLTAVEKALISMMAPISNMYLRIAFDNTQLKRADAIAVRLTGNAPALTSALTKISRGRVNEWWGNTAFNPATSILFAVSPLVYSDDMPSRNAFLMKSQRVFTTPVPPVEERLTILMRGATTPGGTAVPA